MMRRAAIILASLAMAARGAPAVATEMHCDGNEANLNTYLEMTDVLFNQRDGSQAEKYYAAEFITHNTDGGGSDVKMATIETMRAIWRSIDESHPDRVLTNDLILCVDDLVVARVTMRGTMTGPIRGVPPTGKSFAFSAIDIYRFKDGKVIERWGNNDGIGMLTQMGILLPVVQGMTEPTAK